MTNNVHIHISLKNIINTTCMSFAINTRFFETGIDKTLFQLRLFSSCRIMYDEYIPIIIGKKK